MAESAIRWLITEAVLLACMMIAVWAIKRLVTDGTLAFWLTVIVYVIFGGWMFILLLRFAGVSMF